MAVGIAFLMTAAFATDQATKAAPDSKKQSDETWICTFPSQLKGDRRPSIQKWTVSGRVMFDELFAVPVLQVLQNNKIGLVGVHSFAEVEPGHKESSLGVDVFLLDKSTGTAVRSYTSADQNAHLWSGSCVKDSD